MKVVILAGGFGTRISEESHLRPKPMIEIGNDPIMWHIMKIYSSQGFNDFIICCGYKGHMIKEYFADYYLHRSDITFDFTSENNMVIHSNIAEPWRVTVVDTGLHTQTGGRIKRIAPYTNGERFFMTYGDGVSDIDLHELLNVHESSNVVATLTAVQPGGRYGVLDIDEEVNKVSSFREKAKIDVSWINAGFMVLEPDVFDYIDNDDTSFEQTPLERLSDEGKLGVYQHYGFWQCMDTLRDKNALESAWESGNAPWKLW